MLRVHLADLRDSWSAWLGVSIVFVVVNAALVVTGTIMFSGFSAVARGDLDQMQSAGYTATQVLLTVMICFVAMPVIGSATGLVVDSRRGSLARLALAGATPAQVRTVVGSQLVAVSLASAVAGDLLGLAMVRPMLALMNTTQRGDDLWVDVPPTWSLSPVLAANGLCIVVALLGGRRQARRASDLQPVEALRQAQAPVATTRLTRFGGARLALLGLAVVASYAAVPALVQHRNKETVSNLLILGFLQMYVWGAIMSVAGPLLVGPVTRAWTSLVRWSEPRWVLARANVGARADRTQRSLTPVMFCVGLAVGTLGASQSMMRTFEASGVDVQFSGTSLGSFAMVFGLPLAVAFAGGIGSMVMMGRQRDAELALAGLSGATPAQRTWVAVVEALIITGTATVLAAGMVVPVYVYQAYSLTAVGMRWVPGMPWLVALAVVLFCALVTVLATVVPTLPAQRLPENRVIARLVAE